ncbi:MAG: autotransporter domain-containing protein [Pseudomonadota bacterium]
MSRLLRTAAAAALTLAAGMAIAGAASAQTYNRLVVFGDSLSDNGNLFAVSGGTQPPGAFYYQGRFSNGPVFTELLGFNAGRYAAGAAVTGSINYAFGGSRTDTVATPGPGMRTQLQLYTGASGTFGANDLVSVLGGANNIFQRLTTFSALLPGDPQLGNPQGYVGPTALAAASDINFIVNDIATRGAGTILVSNLPKLSLTPQFRTSPAAPLADYAITTFNGALSTQLIATAAARPGTNIILMDIYKIGDTIAANPTAFGVTNVTDACFNQVLLTVCSNPDSYFYYDGVHPTAAGHRVLAALANDYLYYGDNGAQTTLQAETGYRHREEMADAASEVLSGREGWSAGSAMTFGALFDRTETDARGLVDEAQSRSEGIRVGLEWSPSETWRLALGGSARTGDVTGGAQRFDVESFGFDAALGWRSGGVFANVGAGVSGDSYDDIKRATGVGPVVSTGATDGWTRSVRGQAGVWMDAGGLAISPRVGVSWIKSDVGGYTEQGVAAQYVYQNRAFEAVTAEAAIRAEGSFGDNTFYVEGGYRDSLDDNIEAVGTGLSGSPSQVLYRDVADPFGGQVMASAGITREWSGMRMNIGYEGRFGDHADSHMGGISFTLQLP